MLKFVFTSLVFVSITVGFQANSENYTNYVIVINDFLLFGGGLYFILFFGLRFAIFFSTVLLTITSIGADNSSSVAEGLAAFATCFATLFFIDWSISSKNSINWIQASSISITVSALITALLSRYSTLIANEIQAVTIFASFPVKTTALLIVYIIYTKSPNVRIFGSYRRREDANAYTRFSILAFYSFVSIFVIVSLVAMYTLVNSIIETAASRLENERVATASMIEKRFRMSNDFAVQQAYFSGQLKDYTYSRSGIEHILKFAPFIKTIKFGRDVESARTVYQRSSQDSSYEFISDIPYVPCSVSPGNCSVRYGLGSARYKIEHENSLYSYFETDYESLFEDLYVPMIAEDIATGSYFYKSSSFKNIDQDYYYLAERFDNRRSVVDDLSFRIIAIFAASLPDFGIKVVGKANNYNRAKITVFASIKSEIISIQKAFSLIGIVFLSFLLFWLVISTYFSAYLHSQISDQLKKIEFWFLQPDYRLNVTLSQIPELNILFKRIQAAALRQRKEISEKMELSRILLLEHNELTSILDAGGNFNVLVLSETQKVVMANTAAKDLFGIVVGLAVNTNSFAPTDRTANLLLRKVISQYNALKKMSTKQRIEEEFVIYAQDQSKSSWMISTAYYRSPDHESANYSNKYVSWIGNIDELAMARDQAAHVDRLSSLGETLAGIAHELNQPLNVITLAAENCKQILKERDFDREKLIKKLSKMQKQAGRAANLITRIKGHGRSQDEDHQIFEANEAAFSAFEILSPQLEMDSIAIDLNTSSTNPRIVGSQTKLEQILTNIVLNARDAIVTNLNRRDRESISIVISGRETINIAITNHGPTIDRDDLEKIFNPFFTTKKRSEESGLGLGLSICARLVHELKGKIRVTSLSGKTVFNISLPEHFEEASSEDD